mgnify:CR=1 FL=1
MHRVNERAYLLIGVIPPCVLGLLTGFINRGKITAVVKEINKPPLTAPTFVIILIWIALYVILGLATVLILESRVYSKEKLNALVVSYGQLLLHSVWVLVFFRLGFFGLAFLIHVLFLCLICINGILFYQIDKRAGYMIVPYFVFAFYHTYLNLLCIFIN